MHDDEPKILIVEDDQATIVVLEEFIGEVREVGFVWLTTGEEDRVVNALAKNRIIGVFQDWAGTSRGLENARLFGERNIPVAITSACEPLDIATSLETNGVSVEAILSKPFPGVAITNTVRRWLEKATVGKQN